MMNNNDIQLIGAIKIKDGLYIGDQFAAKVYSNYQDRDTIVLSQITHIVNCAGKHLGNFFQPDGIRYLTYLWHQSSQNILFDQQDHNLQQLYLFIQEASELGQSCLIHCYKQQSISLSILAGYLIKKFKWGLYKTLDYLNSRIHVFEIKESVFQQLVQLENRYKRVGLIDSINWEQQKKLSNQEQVIRNTFLNSRKSLLSNVNSKQRRDKKIMVMFRQQKNMVLLFKQDEVIANPRVPWQQSYLRSILKGSNKLFRLKQEKDIDKDKDINKNKEQDINKAKEKVLNKDKDKKKEQFAQVIRLNKSEKILNEKSIEKLTQQKLTDKNQNRQKHNPEKQTDKNIFHSKQTDKIPLHQRFNLQKQTDKNTLYQKLIHFKQTQLKIFQQKLPEKKIYQKHNLPKDKTLNQQLKQQKKPKQQIVSIKDQFKKMEKKQPSERTKQTLINNLNSIEINKKNENIHPSFSNIYKKEIMNNKENIEEDINTKKEPLFREKSYSQNRQIYDKKDFRKETSFLEKVKYNEENEKNNLTSNHQLPEQILKRMLSQHLSHLKKTEHKQQESKTYSKPNHQPKPIKQPYLTDQITNHLRNKKSKLMYFR